MGFFSGIYEIVKKILGWVILPIFKFLRMILWDKTLRKFFNDVLKVTFLVGLVDDYLDVVEALIEDPADLFVMTNKSAWIIIAPWIVNFALVPINKILNKASSLSESVPTAEPTAVEPIVEVPAASVAPVAPVAPIESASVEGELPPIQEGGAIMSVLGASPDMKTYFGLFCLIAIIYFFEKKSMCNEKEKEDPKWKGWNLTKYSFWFGVFITAFYAACFLVLPFVPVIGIFFRITTRIPVVGTVVPGLLTYIAYNILRNITEVMKTRTHCKMD